MSKYYSSSIAFGAKQTKTERVVVSPTKIGDVTTDAVSGALTVDEVPTLDSLNPVSSDGVARAVIQAGAELPTRGSSDTGKVLTVKNSDGDLEWAEAQGGDVDQTYDATSTNAQSGVAVAQAIAAIPSEVSTASGHFDLGGDVPVKVNYTGAASTETQFATLSIDASKGVGTGTCGFNTDNNKSLGSNTATLVFKEPFVLGPAQSFGGFDCNVFYGTSSNLGNGPTLTLSNKPTLVQVDSNMCIAAQSVTLSGANPLAETFPQGEYIGVMVNGANTAIIAASMDSARTNGSIEIQHYPKVVSTGYETTIPVVDQNYHSESANAQSGVAVAQAIAGISVDEVPDVTSTDDGKVLTASYSGGQGSYSWQTAQGGGGGGASYTAGQGIAIDGNNAISVDASARDFSFGYHYDLIGHDNTYSFYIPSGSSSYMHAKDQDFRFMPVSSGSVHLVVGYGSSNYAVCNTSYEFTDWTIPQSMHITLSTTASDWTFTGGTFQINFPPAYLTVAGTTGSTVTPNGETPVGIYTGGAVNFAVVEEPNTLYLKNSVPTVDQSYNASSTHAQSGTAVAQALASAGGGITWTKITNGNITTTSSSLTANLSYSIPSGKTAVQVTIMLRCSNISGSWTVPKQLSVKLKLTDDYESNYYYVGSIISADAWGSSFQPTVWMVAGTVVVPRDWFLSIDGIQLELPMSGGSLPSYYEKNLFVGIA